MERASEKGDYVKCSYEGTLDGKPVAELLPEKPMFGKQANTWEEAGNQTGMGVDAISDGVIGVSAGDKKEITASFPKDFEVEVLAGILLLTRLRFMRFMKKLLSLKMKIS